MDIECAAKAGIWRDVDRELYLVSHKGPIRDHSTAHHCILDNIPKHPRRKATNRATILIRYLPVEDFKDEPNEAERCRLRGEVLHRAMEVILEPLKKAGEEGVEMYCADGRVRRVCPILAAYVADFPEQSDMACTGRSQCPVCPVPFKLRAKYRRQSGRRRRNKDLEALRSYLPHVNFAACVTPDLLHQIHKGLFKGHLVKWLWTILGKERIDARMAAMTVADGMRHCGCGEHDGRRS